MNDGEQFAAAVRGAQPGDSIVMREGEWAEGKLVFEGAGTAEAPIVLRGAAGGRTVLSGKAVLRIAGEHLVVDGLRFRDPDPALGDTIEFRAGSKKTAHHCRLTNCAIALGSEIATKDAPESRWINLYGSDNRVDHCSVQGKANPGTTLVVWLGAGQEGAHQIDHNYFGPRERLGRNGGETIRVGDSASSMQSARCLIERNLFERCNGEVECISNKSCDNIYRENTFSAVSGTLTLRHGNRCVVERNVFLGQGAKSTGGIRIIGEDHIIRGNYLEGLTGSEARASICFMLGVPDSKPNEYFQVKRARIENNTLVDCAFPILIGLSDHARASLPPVAVTFAGNRISAPKRTVIETHTGLEGIAWTGNTFFGSELGIPPRDGIEWKEPQITRATLIPPNEVGPAWLVR